MNSIKFRKDFGNYLKQLRCCIGLTQEEAANKIDRDVKSIRRLECGECLPSMETFYMLCLLYEENLWGIAVQIQQDCVS